MNFDWNNLFNVSGWIIAIVIPSLGFLITKVRDRYTKNVLELSLHKGYRYNNKPNSNVEIFVNEQKIEGSVYDLRIKLLNKGRNDIEGSSFKKPYSIIIPEYASIIKAEIADNPNEDAPLISVNGNNVDLTFGSLLKSKKSYSIDVLISVKDQTKSRFTSDDIFCEIKDKIYAKDINNVTKVYRTNKKFYFPIYYSICGILSIILQFTMPDYELAPEPIFDLKYDNEIICSGPLKCYGDSIYIKSENKLHIYPTSILKDQQTNLIVDSKKQDSSFIKKYQILTMGLLMITLGFIIFFIDKYKEKKRNKSDEIH